MRVAEDSPGRRPGHRRLRAPIACLALGGLALVSTAAASPAPTPAGAEVAAAARIRPPHGKPFAPAVGDWEGTAGGFPASFKLTNVPSFRVQLGLPPYGFSNLVTLNPDSCPARSGRYSEDALTSAHPSPVKRQGGFGLERFGFAGGLTGARRALLVRRFKVGGCSDRLTWHMHPAHRAPVRDGRWKVHYADGESGSFRVESGGRLAVHIVIPASLGKCGGPVGASDLFIGPRGQAAIHQAKLSLVMHFKRQTATGKVSDPARKCVRPLGLTASR
jgi:hypothetical protein